MVMHSLAQMSDSNATALTPEDVAQVGQRRSLETAEGAVADRFVRRRVAQPHMRPVINMGNLAEDDDNDAQLFDARAESSGILPTNAVTLMKNIYHGSRLNRGAIVILLGKQDSSLMHMGMYTKPHGLGKTITQRLEKKNEGKKMKQRHKGIEWIGIDESNWLKDQNFLRKSGWFANVATCGSHAQLITLVRKLAEEIITSKPAADFYMAEVQQTKTELKHTAKVMSALIGIDDESSDDDA